MLTEGSIVENRYRVVRPLGDGGAMKQVYLIENTRLGDRLCALSEITDSFADPQHRQSAEAAFYREARLLAGLVHDHIAHIYDAFSDGNRHFLVMEYVEGETLEETLKAAGGRLDESTVIDIAGQILDALEYLHSLTPPVIYSDLKPSNIMLACDGRVKLIDFGIERCFQPEAAAAVGVAPGYAAPEQFVGKAEPRSDLYALGATMHHMLTGRDPAQEPPFTFPPVEQLRPECTRALAQLITQALALDVSDRVPSAAQFRYRLAYSDQAFPAASSAAPQTLLRSRAEEPMKAEAPQAADETVRPELIENAQFTVYRPRAVVPGAWASMLVLRTLLSGQRTLRTTSPTPSKGSRTRHGEFSASVRAILRQSLRTAARPFHALERSVSSRKWRGSSSIRRAALFAGLKTYIVRISDAAHPRRCWEKPLADASLSFSAAL